MLSNTERDLEYYQHHQYNNNNNNNETTTTEPKLKKSKAVGGVGGKTPRRTPRIMDYGIVEPIMNKTITPNQEGYFGTSKTSDLFSREDLDCQELSHTISSSSTTNINNNNNVNNVTNINNTTNNKPLLIENEFPRGFLIHPESFRMWVNPKNNDFVYYYYNDKTKMSTIDVESVTTAMYGNKLVTFDKKDYENLSFLENNILDAWRTWVLAFHPKLKDITIRKILREDSHQIYMKDVFVGQRIWIRISAIRIKLTDGIGYLVPERVIYEK